MMEKERIYSAEELIEIINEYFEKAKNLPSYKLNGICFSDAYNYGYSIDIVKDNENLIRVYTPSVVYGKVYKTNLKNGFGKAYDSFAEEHQVHDHVFRKNDFFELILHG